MYKFSPLSLFNIHVRFCSESVTRELVTNPPVPRHVATHDQVLADGEPRVDVGLAVLVVAVVEVKGEEDATPTDCDNVFLEISVSCVFDVVGDKCH